MFRQAFFGKNLTFFGNFFGKFFCDFSPHKMRGSSLRLPQDTQKGRFFASPFYTIYYSDTNKYTPNAAGAEPKRLIGSPSTSCNCRCNA